MIHLHPDLKSAQLALLVLLVLFSPLGIDIYLPALPQIAESFHVKHTQAQDTVTWFLFTMGLGQLFAGPLADKFGRRLIALGGVLIYGISAALAYGAQSIDWMLVARLFQGFGACATAVAAFATVRDVFGAEKSGRMISYLNGAICFIPALAPILGSYLTQEFGWRSNFSFMAGFALIALGLMVVGLKETNPAGEEIKKLPVFKFTRYMDVLLHPVFLFNATLCLLTMAVVLAYVTAAPVALMNHLGLSMNEFTQWFGINAVLNIIAAFTAPKIMDRIGTRFAIIIGSIALLCAGGLMLSLSPLQTAWAFMLPIFISTVGFALILGAAAGKALAPFGDKAGTAAALLGVFQMSGAGLLVSVIQRMGMDIQTSLTFHMWLVAPALLILFSPQGKRWHPLFNE
ncbi:Bcr/CflA family drug resistance efflux transporter [Vibrio albus]|uniref:Bcr/CflA family efflux transporter n=1 Tax=Vibrio albus TaxID=2200953 RepID=A0A2U3B4Q2_9VIBR|nr:multidrug effflux MFS transporter [Vibrio albus]PWI31752.1 Bcr/CflA family drug resistance efflux transporter [Vibrio albus]